MTWEVWAIAFVVSLVVSYIINVALSPRRFDTENIKRSFDQLEQRVKKIEPSPYRFSFDYKPKFTIDHHNHIIRLEQEVARLIAESDARQQAERSRAALASDSV